MCSTCFTLLEIPHSIKGITSHYFFNAGWATSGKCLGSFGIIWGKQGLDGAHEGEIPNGKVFLKKRWVSPTWRWGEINVLIQVEQTQNLSHLFRLRKREYCCQLFLWHHHIHHLPSLAKYMLGTTREIP